MKKIREKFHNLSRIQKICFFIVLILIVAFFSFRIPSLARYKNRIPIDLDTVWEGNVATSYRKGTGTVSDPYIISDGSELAYFSSMLNTTNYSNIYFKLNNNIVLNNGIFSYDNAVKYTLNTTTFYVKEYTNEFYDNSECSGIKIGTLNLSNSLNNFAGHFDGDNYTIYGLYISSDNEEVSLFTNLSGSVENLYIKNGMINGGSVTGGISSIANNSTIKNIMYEGYVIGSDTADTHVVINNLSNVNKSVLTSEVDNITLLTSIPAINGEVISTSITGNLTVDNTYSLSINNIPVIVDENGDFSVELGATILNSVEVSYTNASSTTYNLTDLKYNINYKGLVAGGIVGIANNTVLENVINKAYVYGNLNSGGLIGLLNGNVSILQSYNKGAINSSNNAGGLISAIKYNSNNINISKSYNTGAINGSISGSLISTIKNNTGVITIQNTFSNNASSYIINNSTSSIVNITNSYTTSGNTIYAGSVNGTFNISTNLNSKNYFVNTLGFNEFLDSTDLSSNTSNVWVYEDNNLPILFIDDISDPIATLYVNDSSWNDLGFELSTKYYNSSITFRIEEVSNLRPIANNCYYYISSTALTRTQINNITEWTSYSDTVSITNEGTYVIYVKILYNGAVYYINSELLVLDLGGPTISLTNNTTTWNTFKTTLSYLYIKNNMTFTVTTADLLSSVKEVKYYISSTELTTSELDDITSWNDYIDGITISSEGSYIIYIKASDILNNITYINTDIIVYGGYRLNNVYVGRNLEENNIYITDKSNVTLNYTYSDNNGYRTGDTHNIVTNVSLPINTKITLTDNINSKKYVYVVTEDATTYPFTLFKEVGKGVDTYYTEVITSSINENYSINIDLSNTNITSNILNLKLSLQILDNDSSVARETITSTIKGINIYVGSAVSNITTTYAGTIIAYDSDSTTSVPISAGITYNYINSNLIHDTKIEDKILGLSIKLVDSSGNVVDKSYLKNIEYSVNNVIYPIDDDGIARINLNNSINSFSDNIVITTSLDNSSLAKGNYYFKINSYTSYDGKYLGEYSTNTISVPVTNNTSRYTYSFDVLMGDTYKIINKSDISTTMTFSMLEYGPFTNPNIRVSLYKKTNEGYDQSYSIINLNSYVTNALEGVSSNVYYAVKNPIAYNGLKSSYNTFNLNLINSNFENNGYKLVFELYNGSTKVGTVEKKFIVR